MALHAFSNASGRQRRAADAFDFFLRRGFEDCQFFEGAANEHFQERLGAANLVHVRVGIVALAHAHTRDRAAIGSESNETFGRATVAGDIVGLRRRAHCIAKQMAGNVENAQA